MQINFTNIKLKQAPEGNSAMLVTLTELVPSLPTPTENKYVSIDTSTFNPSEVAIMNSFISILKSKLP